MITKYKYGQEPLAIMPCTLDYNTMSLVCNGTPSKLLLASTRQTLSPQYWHRHWHKWRSCCTFAQSDPDLYCFAIQSATFPPYIQWIMWTVTCIRMPECRSWSASTLFINYHIQIWFNLSRCLLWRLWSNNTRHFFLTKANPYQRACLPILI